MTANRHSDHRLKGGFSWPWYPKILVSVAPRATKPLWNVRDNNCADQVDRSNGNLTKCSELMFLNGQRFVLSLFPTGRTTFSTAGRSFWLGWQQVLGPTWRWRVRARVESSWDGAGQLGFRFTHVLFLHVLGQASPVFASFTTLLFDSIWLHGGHVGLWGHTCPLEVTRVTLIAGWPWGHGPGRPNRTLGKQKMFPMERGYSGKCVPRKKKKCSLPKHWWTGVICDWQTLASSIVKDTGTLLNILVGARRHWGVLVAEWLGGSSNTAAVAAAQAVLCT